MSLTNSPFWFSSGATSAGGGGTVVYPYSIDQSLRFNDNDSAYLSRTPASSGDQQKWTFSAWVKRANITLGSANHQTLFSCATTNTQIRFHSSDDTLDVLFGGAVSGHLRTSQVFRDVGSWYHIVVAVDTTQATASNRAKIYINGNQVTAFGTSTYPAQNYNTGINTTQAHNIGRSAFDANRWLDGYFAEINHIDGTALDATSFGETINGIWVPKAYSGSYGINGFYLPFAQDASSGASALFDEDDNSYIAWTDPGTEYEIGASDDYTLELFFNPTSTEMSGSSYIAGYYKTTSPSGYFAAQLDISGNVIYLYHGNGAAYSFSISSGDIVAGQWHHLAFNRASGNLRCFLDGSQKGSTQASNVKTHDIPEFRVNKAHATSNNTFDGYISNVRLVIGSAVYADGTTITVPTSTLTAVTNTKILACTTTTVTKDASSNNVTGTISGGNVVGNNVSPFADFNFYDDNSGNTNDFTANNLTPSDVVPDSPTNGFATLNPLQNSGGGGTWYAQATLSEGNLKASLPANSVSVASVRGTGKLYAEVRWSTVVNELALGLIIPEEYTTTSAHAINTGPNSWRMASHGYAPADIYLVDEGTQLANPAQTVSVGDIFQVAWDTDNGNIWFGYNNNWYDSSGGTTGNPSTGANPTMTATTADLEASLVYIASGNSTGVGVINFGQDSTFAGATTAGGNADANGIGDFAYAPPSGFLSLCSANLPAPAIGPQLASGQQSDNYFEPILYIGSGATQHIGSGGAQHPIDTTTIANSIRFNDNDSAYLSRTPASASNRKTFTLSTWIKPNPAATNYPPIFNAGTSAPDTVIRLDTTGKLQVVLENGGGGDSLLTTNRTLKDSSKWYHILVAVDTTNATADDRIKIYIDGVEETSFSSRTNPSLNLDTNINNTVVHKIGAQRYASYWDGYMAEMYFIDGTALDPTSFGQYGSNGYWIPKAVSGLTYGTNGFYLDFSDNSTATALGTDSSGNGNDFGATNVATTDQMGDSPTQNFNTLNPNGTNYTSYAVTLSEGNLKAAALQAKRVNSMFGVSSGKWYFETKSQSENPMVGVALRDGSNSIVYDGAAGYIRYYAPITSGSPTNITGYATWTTTDIIGVAFDVDNNQVEFFKNNTSIGTFDFVMNSETVATAGYQGGTNVQITFNFGADDSFAGNATGGAQAADGNGYGSFYYTPPTGYLALVDDNIPVEGLTGPDFTWIKGRSNADYNYLVDNVRGYTERLFSNLSDGASVEANTVASSDYQGFTLGSDAGVNRSGSTYVSWNWKAGGKANTFNIDGTGYASMTAAGLTDGTIPLTGLSANTTAGFSIVGYTGTGTAGTVAHGLSSAPEMVIVKERGGTGNWFCYHKGAQASGAKVIYLNMTNAAASSTAIWNNTQPTDTVFSLGTGNSNTNINTYIAYCFHSIPGYSAVGKYVGNANADGPFVYTGFRPAFVLLKVSSAANNWFIYDNRREGYNQENDTLSPNLSTVEDNTYKLDLVSNGFKIRGSNNAHNQSGQTFIYLAFAEQPFKYANAR